MAAALCVILSIFLIQCKSQTSCGEVDASAATRDRRWNNQKLKIVNYNAEWLFIDSCEAAGWNAFLDTTAGDRGIGGIWTWGIVDINAKASAADKAEIKALATTHLKNIGEFLATLEADVIVLEEVCDCHTLKKVIEIMEAKDNIEAGKYKAYMDETQYVNRDLKQRIGIITTLDPNPKSGVNKHANIVYNADYRGFKSVHTIGNKQFSLFGVHFHSGEKKLRSMESRIKEAGHLVTAVDGVSYSVVTGDFNTASNKEVPRDRALKINIFNNIISAKKAVQSFNDDVSHTVLKNKDNKLFKLDLSRADKVEFDGADAVYGVIPKKGDVNAKYGTVISDALVSIKAEFNEAVAYGGGKTAIIEETYRRSYDAVPLVKQKYLDVMSAAFAAKAKLKSIKLEFKPVFRETTFSKIETKLTKVASDGVGDQWSHKSLARGNPTSKYDWFFISNDWPSYAAVRFSYKTDHVHNKYSDHVPVVMEIDLAHQDWRTYAAQLSYNNHLHIHKKDSHHFHPILHNEEEEPSFISMLYLRQNIIMAVEAIIIILQIIIFGVICAGCGAGCFMGASFVAAKLKTLKAFY